MGAYNSSQFSKMFSERTETNYKYISKIVKKDEEEKRIQKELVEKYGKVLEKIKSLEEEVQYEANNIVDAQKKGKDALTKKLRNIARKIGDSGENLKKELGNLISMKEIEGQHLYEVTQLLNSLMGIAVLPYEMHKEFFKYVDKEQKSEDNRGMTLNQIQNSVKRASEYLELECYIMELYKKGKWDSTFSDDKEKNQIKEDKIVFGFLKHIRNVTCHSGDNAISILPLTDGTIIENVIFYDNYKGQEFAMDLTIEELETLIFKIADFYKYSRIGEINKTKNIKEAEERVKDILNKRQSEC